MGVLGEESGFSRELENGFVRLRVTPNGRLSLSSKRYGVAIEGVSLRAVVDGRPVSPAGAYVERIETGNTQLGPARRMLLRWPIEEKLELSSTIELGPEWPGVVIRAALQNRGPRPVRLERLDPFAWRAETPHSRMALPGPNDCLELFRMGYQSWSPAGFIRIGQRDRRPRIPLARAVHFGPLGPLPSRGLLVSDFAATLGIRDKPGITLGFLDHERFLGWIELRHSRGNPTHLSASSALEGLYLQAGARLLGASFWFGIGASAEQGLSHWAELTGRVMHAPVPARVGSGWCSWYRYFTRVTDADIQRNTRILRERGSDLETVQIDDGFQAAVGDWLEPGSGFPQGIAASARGIREAGFRAGLWLAPLLVSRASQLAKQHPDWLLRGPRGRPRIAMFNPAWKGKICFALDPTHPEVSSWLYELGRTLRGYGYDYLKLDFLYAGTLPGQRHDPSIPSGAAYRNAIQAIREGAGENVELLGCGAPLGPSIGMFEAMRIGPDVARSWRAPLSDWLLGVPASPALRNAVRNVIARAPLHRRLWLNDPDCVLLGQSEGHLDLEESRTLVSVAAVSGGPIFVSDDLERLSATRQQWLARLVPIAGVPPERIAMTDERLETLGVRGQDGSLFLLCLNLHDRPICAETDLEALGFPGPVHIYDIWSAKVRATRLGKLSTDAIAPHGCVLLRLTRADRAQVTGCDLHITGGLPGSTRIESSGENSARVQIELPGSHRARVWIGLAPEVSIPIHMEFRDQIALEVTHETWRA